MTSHDIAKRPYRRGVGVVLTNTQGAIFAGQRADKITSAWQMPQGGIEPNETPLQAAYRELHEETGVQAQHVTHKGETAQWLNYDLPADMAARLWGGRYRGQTQKWMWFQLDALDDVIDLTLDDVEFSTWRWMTAAELLTRIVPFKRDLYTAVLGEFGLLGLGR